jgi:hypothetical protein
MPDRWIGPTRPLAEVSPDWLERFQVQCHEAIAAGDRDGPGMHYDGHQLRDTVWELTRRAKASGHPPERIIVALRTACGERTAPGSLVHRDSVFEAIVRWSLAEYFRGSPT